MLVSVALIAAVFAVPYGTMQMPDAVGFMPAIGSLTCFADLFTTVLLVGQARAANRGADMHLAAAYLFSFLVVIPYFLSFPGIFAPGGVIGADGTASWLWCVWHAGFAVFVAGFAIRAKDERVPSGRSVALFAVVGLCAAGAVAMALWGLADLPVILVGENYRRLNTLGIGPVVFACNMAALVLVVTRLQMRSTIGLWVAVAMVAACLDVGLGLVGCARFTFGWYLGQALSLLSNFTVFIALLFESMGLFARVSRVNRHLEHLSLTDQLTQLPNRRAFERHFAVEWRRAEREVLPISLLMVDVDQFKGFNDSFGHPAGDRCLQLVADTLAAVVRRPLDLAARLGGEEFVLLLPNTEAAGAAWLGERVRAAIESLQIVNPGSSRGFVTVSVGVATDSPRNPGNGATDLIDRADSGLYAAKNAGRNYVYAVSSEAAAAYPADAMAWCKADMVAQRAE